MKKRIITILALMCLGISFVFITSYYSTKSSEPMLKITTSTQIGFYFSNTKYYIVYENGTVKKANNFVPADVKRYRFFSRDHDEDLSILHIDVDDPQRENMIELAKNIWILMDETKFENISIGALYVLDEKYFFDAGVYKSNKYTDRIFEYIPADNSIKEIVSFNGKSITHVELYEPE